jgi:hypothetical protein
VAGDLLGKSTEHSESEDNQCAVLGSGDTVSRYAARFEHAMRYSVTRGRDIVSSG